MIHHEDNLVVRVLKAGQVCNVKSFILVIQFSYGSHLWKSMEKVWEKLKDKIMWDVGNATNFRWVGEYSLRSLISAPLTLGESELNVDNLLSNGKWDSLSFLLKFRSVC